MEIVGRAHDEIINWVAGTFYFLQMPIKAFKFGKKCGLWEILIQDTHGIIGIVSGNQLVTRFFYGLNMSRCDIASSTNERKFFQNRTLFVLAAPNLYGFALKLLRFSVYFVVPSPFSTPIKKD